ncbi:MAG: Clp1/GlmU family protein [bacterium]
MTQIMVPQEWEGLLPGIKEHKPPRIIMLVGGIDTGKTTLCGFLFDRLSAQGERTLLIDADLGQSVIGPPATVGLADTRDSRGIFNPLCLQFVGSTSPRGHMLQTLVAVKKVVDKARRLRPDNIIMDTSGFVTGAIGSEFKFQKIDLIHPTHLILLEREGELGFLYKNISCRKGTSVFRMEVPFGIISPKSPDDRRRYREERFRGYFTNARPVSLSLEKMGLHGMVPDLYEGSCCQNLLVGLCDGNNNTLSLGIVTHIDPSEKIVTLLSPIDDTERIRSLQFGSIRVRKSGEGG